MSEAPEAMLPAERIPASVQIIRTQSDTTSEQMRSLPTPTNSGSTEERGPRPAETRPSNIDLFPHGQSFRSPSSETQSYTIFRGDKQPASDQRFEQIKTFLSDEDIFRCVDFERKLDELEAYIDDIEHKNYEYDSWKVREIKQMIQIHHDWISNDGEVMPLRIDFIDNHEPWQLKLAALSKDPDALQARIHQLVDCWKHSVGVLNTGIYDLGGKLPTGETLCLALERDEQPREPDPLEYSKKTMQYRRRNELAYSVVRKQMMSEHQNDLSFVPPPANWNGPYLPRSRADVAQGKKARYEMLQVVFQDLINAHRVAPRDFLSDILREIESVVTNVDGPYSGLELTGDEDLLTDADIDGLDVFTQPSWLSSSSPIIHTDPDKTFALLLFYGHLQIAIRDFDIMGQSVQDGCTVDLIAEVVNKLRVERNETDEMLSRDEVDDFVRHICEAGHLSSTFRREIIWNVIPDVHPEHEQFIIAELDGSVPPSSPGTHRIAADGSESEPTVISHFGIFIAGARRLGHEIRQLLSWQEESESEHGEQWDATQLLQDEISDNPDAYGLLEQQTLAELVAPLVDPDDVDNVTEEEAAQLLQNQVILEQHQNYGPREPDFTNLWAWAEPLPEERGECKFFSLDRWPLELQTKERQRQIWVTGPELPLEQQSEEQGVILPERAKDVMKTSGEEERETYYPGECFFPFGETEFQRAYQSYQIKEDLKNLPAFAGVPEVKERNTKAPVRDVFALPELDERVSSQIARKRPHGDALGGLTEHVLAETENVLEDLELEARRTAGSKRKANNHLTGGQTKKYKATN